MFLSAALIVLAQVFIDRSAITSRVIITNCLIYLVFIGALLWLLRTVLARSKYRIDSPGITIQYRREGRTDEITLQPGDIEKHYLSTRWIYGKYGLVDVVLVTKSFDIPIEAISKQASDKILRHLKLAHPK